MMQHLCSRLQLPRQLPWLYFQQYSLPEASAFAHELEERLPFPFGRDMASPFPFDVFPFFFPLPFPFGV